MKKKPEIQHLEIVFLGDFNPVIFSPAWFVAHGLLGETEAESADVQIIHSDVAIINHTWFRLQVTRERFSIHTEQEAYFQFVCDFATGIFDLLCHTPMYAMGVNLGMHIKFDSDEEWHNFGHFIAPKKPWENVLKNSAMRRIHISEKFPPENPLEGALDILVEPSPRVKPGVYFNINNHFETREKETGCKLIIEKLKETWKEANKKSEKAIETVLKNFEVRNE